MSIVLTVFWIFTSINAEILPTISNATGSFYISSNYSWPYFLSESITCHAAYCHIVCDESESCIELTVNATAAPSTTLVIQCLHSYSCRYIVIHAETAKSVQITCDYDASDDEYSAPCYPLQLNAGDNTSCDIQCTEPKSCLAISVHATAKKVKQLTVNCAGSSSCADLSLDFTNISQFDLYCSSSLSCSGAYVFGTTTNNSSIGIRCASTGHACNDAEFEIDGVMSDMSFLCGSAYDCHGVSLGLSHFASTQIVCNASTSVSQPPCYQMNVEAVESEHVQIECKDFGCESVSISGYEADQLSIECAGYKACKSVNAYCPRAGSCSVDCLFWNACITMRTTIANKDYDQLNINCDASAYGCDASAYGCDADDESVIYCTRSDELGQLTFSHLYQSMVCDGFCCPTNFLPPTYPSSTTERKEEFSEAGNDDNGTVAIAIVILCVLVLIAIIIVIAAVAGGFHVRALRKQLEFSNRDQMNVNLNLHDQPVGDDTAKNDN
eukprot:394941_1